MKRYLGFVWLAVIFLVVTVLLFFVHFLIFRDARGIWESVLGTLAFLPVQVFIWVVVLQRIIANRDKQVMLQKLNMVVGAFFSETGNETLRCLLPGMENKEELFKTLNVSGRWMHRDFQQAVRGVGTLSFRPTLTRINLYDLRTFLVARRSFLLGLLENPNLLENERFTDLLWATFHVTEELEARASFENLPPSDLAHITGDIERMYSRLVVEWVAYVEHLKAKYPYLFSLLLRTHPFQEKPSPIVV
jgi:hypothetical protein